jgi:DNA-directed RNA polymerase subunit M/transcription elongation factor TFIIS
MTQSTNPLRQFFRQPAIYLKLPSAGRFWPASSLDLPANGEVPVYPMTAIDEITYRTPDALFNGQAVISVIQSCVPAIKNAWHMPNIDLNPVLIAIRIASYGHDMSLNTTCPACNHEEEYSLDMRTVLDQIRSPNFAETINHGDLEIIFKPVTYEQQNQSSIAQFEQQKLLSVLPTSDLPEEEKMARLSQSMKIITDLTINIVAESITAIKTPNAAVTDTPQIEEFLRNCDSKVYNQIRNHVVELRQQSEIQPLIIKCTECEHEYTQPVDLDLANFFDSAS